LVAVPGKVYAELAHRGGQAEATPIAEKFQTLVKLGMAKTRMKDLYDVWLLAREFEFDGRALSKAIEATSIILGEPSAT